MWNPKASAAHWFTSDSPSDEGPGGWRLDVVTLLAVIGESSIADHAQIITASAMCLMPRVIPAPQALLKPSRPIRLPETFGNMTGVYSGVHLNSVSFFANIIHPLSNYKKLDFEVLEITHTTPGAPKPANPKPQQSSRKLARWFASLGANSGIIQTRPTGYQAHLSAHDVEMQGRIANDDPVPGIKRQPTKKEMATDWLANPHIKKRKEAAQRPLIPARLFSPIHILTIVSTLLTFGIIALSIYMQDGTAIVAVTMVAFTSSIVGLASWWHPKLSERSSKTKVPDGDVIIRTREGAFLLIKCTEEVARELYSGTEECQYVCTENWYRILMGIGTLLLMVSVILLGNCSWWCQVAIGISYITLNGLYWCLGLLPKKYFWDLSRYNVVRVTPKDSRNAGQNKSQVINQEEDVASFTRTLWYAIRETKQIAWVRKNGAAPDTPQWKMWLNEAKREAQAGRRDWPAVKRKNEIMREDIDDDGFIIPNTPASRRQKFEYNNEEAAQRVPAEEIQAPPQNPPVGAG